MLCNDDVASEVRQASILFHAFPPIKVKGYSQLVQIYQPELDVDAPLNEEGRATRMDPFSGAVKSKRRRSITEMALAKLDACDFKQQMIVKLSAALAISSHSASIARSVIVGLYPGPSAEVDEMLESLVSLKLLIRAETTALDTFFTFLHPSMVGAIYDALLSDQRMRFHAQLVQWFRRMLLLRLEQDDAQPTDLIVLLDTLAEQIWRSGDVLDAARYLAACAWVHGEVCALARSRSASWTNFAISW